MSLEDKTKPIVHIVRDEKFTDDVYNIFEKAFPDLNLFVVLKQDNKKKFLDSSKPYEYLSIDKNYLEQVISKIDGANSVVFHGINKFQAEVILNTSHLDIEFIWLVYGEEVYNNPEIINYEIYGPITKKKYITTISYSLKDFLRRLYYKIFYGIDNSYIQIKKAIKIFDYVGILYKEEISLYQELGILNKNAKFLKFTFYPIDLVIDTNMKIRSNNILLGNSASYSNNHLEAFSILEKFKIDNRKIITPLSYGDNNYAKDMEKRGNDIFGEKFIALKKFYPLKEYQNILQSCGIVIMNHYRQQGIGNVLNAMSMGAKVYLSNRNTLYHYLKRLGCFVFCIEEDLNPCNLDALSLLDNEKININREIMREELALNCVCTELQQKIDPSISY